MMHKCSPDCGACNKSGYEQGDIDFLKSHATRDSVFFDVGAHAGLYTAQLAPLVKQVIAVEPVTHDVLFSNVGHLGNVVIVDAFAWSHPRIIGVEYRANGQSFAKLGGFSIAINLEIFGQHIKRLLFKIDVEGAVIEALMGMKGILMRTKEIFGVIEVDANHMTRFNSDPTQIGAHLQGLKCVSGEHKNHHYTKEI